MSFICAKNLKYLGLLCQRDYCEIRVDMGKNVELRKVGNGSPLGMLSCHFKDYHHDY